MVFVLKELVHNRNAYSLYQNRHSMSLFKFHIFVEFIGPSELHFWLRQIIALLHSQVTLDCKMKVSFWVKWFPQIRDWFCVTEILTS